MRKRILALVLAAAMILSLSGCMGTASANTEKLSTLELPEEEWTEGSYPDFSQYDGDLDGLCGFMEEAGVVLADESYPVETNAEVIGAKAGKRYRFKFNGSTVQAEFYEFDPAALSDEAKAYFADAAVQGQIKVLNHTVPAYASDDNKFMMLYIDTKKDAANEAHREMASSCFQNFCVNH